MDLRLATLALLGAPYIYDISSLRVKLHTKAVRKVSVHFEYLENRSRGLDVTWQHVREDLTVHP